MRVTHDEWLTCKIMSEYKTWGLYSYLALSCVNTSSLFWITHDFALCPLNTCNLTRVALYNDLAFKFASYLFATDLANLAHTWSKFGLTKDDQQQLLAKKRPITCLQLLQLWMKEMHCCNMVMNLTLLCFVSCPCYAHCLIPDSWSEGILAIHYLSPSRVFPQTHRMFLNNTTLFLNIAAVQYMIMWREAGSTTQFPKFVLSQPLLSELSIH